MREYTIAARYAEASFPQKSQFFLPIANGRTARSTGLLSIVMRPSLTYLESLGRSAYVYSMACPILLLGRTVG